MSLYTEGQRVWCKSLQSLGFITEARYVTYGGKRKAEYVIDLVTGVRKLIDGKMQDVRVGQDWMCGSSDLRAADYCCDGCSRWLPGTAHRQVVDGAPWENSFLHFCFLCSDEHVIGYW
jgi:hypothetical protein